MPILNGIVWSEITGVKESMAKETMKDGARKESNRKKGNRKESISFR